jgi:hypothetical protein
MTSLLVVTAAMLLTHASATELVLEQPPFVVYSAFWINLHHVLLTEAATRQSQAAIETLTSDERRTWNAAVEYYGQELVARNPLFEMGPIRKALIAAAEVPGTSGLADAHRSHLLAAAPVFRKYWWRDYDATNRDWAAEVMKRVASLSPGVPDRIAALYGNGWIARGIRVDVVPTASREGAFTTTDPAPAHITISSRRWAMDDWTSVEMLFHETSHALALPIVQAFAAESQAQGKDSRDLWHVALFYMTGEAVREALARRKVPYEPFLYSTNMFTRAWPQFRGIVETYWKSYVNGEISRDDAIKRSVADLK